MNALNPATDEAPARHSVAGVADYFALLKPRVMALVVFTAVIGLIVAPDGLPWIKSFVAILCIAIGAGASGALNQWYDADIDSVMTRTAARPVPQGRIPAQAALEFGMVLSAFSVLSMAVLVNYVAAGLLAFTIFFYAVIYTMLLKRRTSQNIVIGGAAGALPPVIAWAAATGGTALMPWLLFAIIFLWTPAHFWALALVRHEDYRRARVPMLPVTHGAKVTKRQIVAYAVLTALMGLSPAFFGSAGTVYLAGAGALGATFVGLAVWLWRAPSINEAKAAMRLFAFSILYLFLLFALLGLEHGLRAGMAS